MSILQNSLKVIYLNYLEVEIGLDLNGMIKTKETKILDLGELMLENVL